MFRSTPPVIGWADATTTWLRLMTLFRLCLSQLGEPGLGGWPLSGARRGITIVEDDLEAVGHAQRREAAYRREACR